MIRNNRLALLWSVLSAIGLFLVCYFVDNVPYSFVNSATVGQHIEQLRQLLKGEDDPVPDELFLINVAYDRELTTAYDDNGFEIGNIDVTDRKKLIRLLRKLKEADYNYIMLDVALDDKYTTADDKELADLILSMPNVILPKSSDYKLVDKRLNERARYSDYSVHIAEYNFVKYDFLRENENTMAYQLYQDLTGNKIERKGPFYFFNGNLANKSVVLRHPVKLWNKFREKAPESEYASLEMYNMGVDLLDIDANFGLLANKKIVVIGDFTDNDLHDTYLGKIAGPIININAYYALANDNLSLPWWYILFLLVLYFSISFCIMRRIPFFERVGLLRKIKSKLIRFFFSLVGVTTLLTIIGVLVYLIFSLEFNILIPSIYFSILLALVNYKNYRLS